MRIGMGYDVHSVMPGRGVTLGGVRFPDTDFSLRGHSDADVLIHALCDALLGAAGLPDIGILFPDHDTRHRDRDSMEFLSDVAARIRAEGYQAVNVDCMLIAEKPKIQDRVMEMKGRIGPVLGLETQAVGIKATTNEKLGSLGRGEGIAAMAVALLNIREALA